MLAVTRSLPLRRSLRSPLAVGLSLSLIEPEPPLALAGFSRRFLFPASTAVTVPATAAVTMSFLRLSLRSSAGVNSSAPLSAVLA